MYVQAGRNQRDPSTDSRFHYQDLFSTLVDPNLRLRSISTRVFCLSVRPPTQSKEDSLL